VELEPAIKNTQSKENGVVLVLSGGFLRDFISQFFLIGSWCKTRSSRVPRRRGRRLEQRNRFSPQLLNFVDFDWCSPAYCAGLVPIFNLK
jgi:hypothetical protein